MDARVQPEIADQLLRVGKAVDGTDRRHDADRNDHVDPWDRYQPLRVLVRQNVPCQVSLDYAEIVSEPVIFPHVALDRKTLIRRHGLLREPCATFGTEQVRRRAGRDQVRMQDGLHDILQTCALANQLVPPGDLPAQRLGPLVGYPDFRQKSARVEPRQHRCVDAIGLDLGVRDQPYLLRIGNHHAADVRTHGLGHRRRVAGCFDHHMIVMG